MRKTMEKSEIYRVILQILNNHGVDKISIFGSYAKGLETSESDIDIIVEFSTRKSLLELVSIENELSDQLGVKVDLLTEKSISPYLITAIKEEMETIYP